MAMSEEIFRQTGIPDGYKIRIHRKGGYMWIKDTKEGQVHSRYRFHNVGRYVLVEEESEASVFVLNDEITTAARCAGYTDNYALWPVKR